MEEIKFSTPVAYNGKKWGTAVGIAVYAHDSIEYNPDTNPVKVVSIVPVNKRGMSAVDVEIPSRDVEAVCLAMMKATNPLYDEIKAAKDVLIRNGYVDFFVSSEEIRIIATEEQWELSDEDLATVIEILSNNDLEIGICEEAVRGAISEACVDATDQEWKEDDETPEFRHIESQYSPDQQ